MFLTDIAYLVYKYHFMKMEKSKNIVIGMLIVIIILGAYFLYSRSTIDHAELFTLKEECADKAQKYANDNKSISIGADVNWEVLYSDYVVNRKSCFAEFRKSIFITNTGEKSEYLYIYDLLTGQTMASLRLTYEESWEDEAPATYQKVRKQILGLEKD